VKENMRKLIEEDSYSNIINVNNHVVIEDYGSHTLMDILEEEKENPNLFNLNDSNTPSNNDNKIMEKKTIFIKTIK
jgi:hypothetical protein